MKHALAATALLFALPASADTVGQFSSLLVFGDSLSDPGNAEAATLNAGGTWLYSIYPEGQLTNGDTWATQLGADFSSGTNFAFGRAAAITNADESPDFDAQRDSYTAALPDLGGRPLTAIWFGGNDFRAILGDSLPTDEQVLATANGIITSITTGILELSQTGLSEFLVFGLPDLGTLPAIVGTALEPRVSAAIGQYNLALEESLMNLELAFPDLSATYFDLNSLFVEVLGDADAFGFTNTTETCLGNPVECLLDANQFFFYDDLHPTEAVHSLIAQGLLDEIRPIPLPGSLGLAIGGLLLLGLVGRRNNVATV